MVTSTQLQILPSPITSLISIISSSVTVKLDDSNYLTWNFQIELLLEGHGLMGFVDGSHPCPARFNVPISEGSFHPSSDVSSSTESDEFKIWKMHDRALMQLLTATLSPSAVSCAIARDYLFAARVQFDDDDIVILTLNGLSSEYNTLRSIIRGRENVISMKDLRSQLLAEETMVENIPITPFLSAMVARNNGTISKDEDHSNHTSYGGSSQCTLYSSGSSGFKPTYSKNKHKGKFQYYLHSRFGNSKTTYGNYNVNSAPGILGASPPWQQGPLSTSCQIYGKHSNTSPPVPTAMHVSPSPHPQSSDPLQQIWLIDSRASSHMTADLSNLSLASPYPANETIQTASGAVFVRQRHQTSIILAKNGISKKKAFLSVVQDAAFVDLSQMEPATYKSALKSPVWLSAMNEELAALQTQHTWSLVPFPHNKNLVGCKWIFKIKRHADGSISWYKTRLVAKGFNQEEGIDYGETFSPVIKPTTVRLVLALASHFGWSLCQLDVKNAFLHGILNEEVYMSQPPGFTWNERFTSFLPSLGFLSTYYDPSLFVKHDGHSVVILLLYVDDIIITGSDYSKYVSDLLVKADMVHSKPCSTPCLPYNRLLKDDGHPFNNPSLYHSIVGALQYLTFTRPDISFSVHQVC
ncbi:hypothetical protein D8674_023153 [Pyrus ussuriensis x Pyrus communis]|uniref:Reverse transcriptase Ty1/copia-type domain-containing protein n=1 Tax=Pyrus ussuriensis x Pyrus communis TaxID=2448454 RepID=A0A5N5GLZ7_9ROSA|nr:hypothetical protein D8674_023153 [Pyrus ussuriensis x Pyrus communis]